MWKAENENAVSPAMGFHTAPAELLNSSWKPIDFICEIGEKMYPSKVNPELFLSLKSNKI